MSGTNKQYGIVILLDALGTRQRIQDYIDNFLNDWDSVLKRLEENAKILEKQLSEYGYKTAYFIVNYYKRQPFCKIFG